MTQRVGIDFPRCHSSRRGHSLCNSGDSTEMLQENHFTVSQRKTLFQLLSWNVTYSETVSKHMQGFDLNGSEKIKDENAGPCVEWREWCLWKMSQHWDQSIPSRFHSCSALKHESTSLVSLRILWNIILAIVFEKEPLSPWQQLLIQWFSISESLLPRHLKHNRYISKQFYYKFHFLLQYPAYHQTSFQRIYSHSPTSHHGTSDECSSRTWVVRQIPRRPQLYQYRRTVGLSGIRIWTPRTHWGRTKRPRPGFRKRSENPCQERRRLWQRHQSWGRWWCLQDSAQHQALYEGQVASWDEVWSGEKVPRSSTWLEMTSTQFDTAAKDLDINLKGLLDENVKSDPRLKR